MRLYFKISIFVFLVILLFIESKTIREKQKKKGQSKTRKLSLFSPLDRRLSHIYRLSQSEQRRRHQSHRTITDRDTHADNRVTQTEVIPPNPQLAAEVPHIEREFNFVDGDRMNIDDFMTWMLTSFRSSPTPHPEESRPEQQKQLKQSQKVFIDLERMEQRCSVRRQLFGVINQRATSSEVQLWVADSRACVDTPRLLEWRTLRKKAEQEVEIGPAVFGLLEFNVVRQLDPTRKIKTIKQALRSSLRSITALVQEIWDAEGAERYFPDVPILFRSTLARDVPIVARETILYVIRHAINDYRDETKINVFTVPQLSPARSGIVEALDAFHSINFHKIPELINATERHQDSSNANLHEKLDGVLDVGHSTVEIAFPVPRPIKDGAIRTIEVQFKHPTIPIHSVSVFATSFVNYGAMRALALLVKAYCHQKTSLNGICHFPCFNHGWRQHCYIGEFSLPEDVSPRTGAVIPKKNELKRPSGFCNPKRNPSIQLARLRETCDQALLNSTVEDDDERMAIPGCIEIHGTGDAQQCSHIIDDFVIQRQYPANQDAISVGASLPSEVGKSELFFVVTRLRVVGRAVNNSIHTLRKMGWLPKKSGEILYDILRVLGPVCQMEVDIRNGKLTSQSVPTNPDSKSGRRPAESVALTFDTANLCFRLSYAIRLLSAFGVTPSKGGDLVLVDDFSESQAILDFKNKLKWISRQLPPFSVTPLGPIPDAFDIENSDPMYGLGDDPYPESSLLRCNRRRSKLIETTASSLGSLQRPFEKSLGMILSQIFSYDLLKNIFILGAAHWKNSAFMSPIDDTINRWLVENANFTMATT